MDYITRAKNFRAKKRLGQNFLVDENIIMSIMEHSEVGSNEIVVEIGPGLGFVTEQLVKCAKKVIAVELDSDVINILKKIPCDNLELLNQDILKTDLSQFGTNLKVVANIPYYITSPILAHLLGEFDDLNNKNRKSINEIYLMVQYEVAQRLVANENSPSKQYGLLSILAQFYADVEIVEFVPSKSFFPRPKVDSAIVKIKINNKPKVETMDYEFLKKVTKACFATRRKTLKNSLCNFGFDKNAVEKTLQALNFKENIRGENLSIEDMKNLSEELKKWL